MQPPSQLLTMFEKLAVQPIVATAGSLRITLSTSSAASAASATAILASGGASSTSAQVITGGSLNGTIGTGVLSPNRRLEMVFSSHADWDATTATIKGTDFSDTAVSDTFSIPNNGNATVTGTTGIYFKTVTEIDIPAQSGAGGTFTVGYTAVVAPGYYVVSLDKTGGVCWASWSATAALPTTGLNSTSATFAVRDGDIVIAPGATSLSAILTGSGTTGELAITQLA